MKKSGEQFYLNVCLPLRDSQVPSGTGAAMVLRGPDGRDGQHIALGTVESRKIVYMSMSLFSLHVHVTYFLHPEHLTIVESDDGVRLLMDGGDKCPKGSKSRVEIEFRCNPEAGMVFHF
jgi:hypothetical protein